MLETLEQVLDEAHYERSPRTLIFYR